MPPWASRAHRWVPARTPTVHRCPQGKAVGGPQHDPQCDKRAQPKDRHHCLEQRAWLRSCAQSSSAQDRIQQRTERIVDVLDKKLTDSLWAVASNRDRKHKETRQTGVTRVKSEELIDKSRMISHRPWKTNSAQLRTRVTHHQHSGGGKARHNSRAGRSQSTDRKGNVGLVMNQ